MAMKDDGYKPATLAEQKEARQTNLTTMRAAVAAHLGGAGWDWIAERYAYTTPEAARVAVEGFLGQTFSSTDTVSARNKARARYERLLQGTWYDATHPFLVDEDGKQTETRNEAYWAAVDRARGLVGDITRLDGLNAPTQLQLYVPGADEIMSVVSTLREAKMVGMAKEADIFDADFTEDDDDDGS